MAERELRFDRRMSDAEALMWNVEKDPWLNPNGAMVTILDQPVDFEQFRRRIRHAVASIPRLRERVVPGLARLSPPTWSTDPEFDFDYHVRRIRVEEPGTIRQVYDLGTRLYQDPFDRTRPLWMFVVIDGLEDGRGAFFSKLHHSISDGQGLVRLSELYMERERDAPLPPDADLDAVIEEALEAEAEEARIEAGGDRSTSLAGTAMRSMGHLARRQMGISRRAMGEAALWTADPERILDLGRSARDTVGTPPAELARPGGDEEGGGSPLWKQRSRYRHLEAIRVPLEDAKAAGKSLGGSINDVFVTGAVEGSLRYHAERDAPASTLLISFVVSTRKDKAIGGNSFTPTRLRVPGGPASLEDRFRAVRDLMAAKREGVKGNGALSGLAGVANLLPTSLVTRLARSQAAAQDFATSNLRAAPFTMYVSGARILWNVTMGPVAGTAFNLTTVSYDGSLDMGLFVDPKAVAEPVALRQCLDAAYTELLAAGGVVRTNEGEGTR